MDPEGALAPLTDREVEGILRGRPPKGRPEVEALLAFVEMLRCSRTDRPARPDAALSAAFAEGLPADLPPPPAWAVPPELEPLSEIGRWPIRWTIGRRRLQTAVNVMLGTMVGKVMFGAAIVTASVGGAHAAGVIDVPRLPDRWHAVERANEWDVGGADQHHGRGGQAPSPSPTAGPAGDHDSEREPGGRNARSRDADQAPDIQPGTGVDGDRASERATNGEPRPDGEELGRRTADEARDGTPGVRSAGGADAGTSGQPQSRGRAPATKANPGAEHAGPDHRPHPRARTMPAKRPQR